MYRVLVRSYRVEACRGGNFGPELPSFAGSPVETSTLIRRYYWQATSTSARSWERVLVEKELGPFRAEGAKLLVPRTQKKRVKRVLLLILVEDVEIVVVINRRRYLLRLLRLLPLLPLSLLRVGL